MKETSEWVLFYFFFLFPFGHFLFLWFYTSIELPHLHTQLGAVSLLFFLVESLLKNPIFHRYPYRPAPGPAAVEKHILLKFGIFLFRGMDGCRPPRKKANRVQKRYLAKMATAELKSLTD